MPTSRRLTAVIVQLAQEVDHHRVEAALAATRRAVPKGASAIEWAYDLGIFLAAQRGGPDDILATGVIMLDALHEAIETSPGLWQVTTLE